MMTIDEMVGMAKAAGASDVHLICGLPPKIRVDGQLENMTKEILTQDDCMETARYLAGGKFDRLMAGEELDSAGMFAGNRCRLHLFCQQGVPSLALRILKEDIPELEQLGIPEAVKKLAELHKGIVLITGETGSGKSTTLAALIDRINHGRRAHIITLEDPVEYIYTPDQCAINQREVGRDTRSFAEGVRASLREDPDVILIGEIRDNDTISAAITAAETGHLVFGTLHTGAASDAVDRMVQGFPEGMQQQIRLQLSMCLMAVLTQQLVPGLHEGRVLACEYMPVTDAIRNMIRTGNTPQIANAVATSSGIGGRSMDQDLARLYREKQISKQTALDYAHDSAHMKKLCI